jgi:hypothetical protein
MFLVCPRCWVQSLTLQEREDERKKKRKKENKRKKYRNVVIFL